MPQGRRRSHTRTTKSGRTVHVSQAKIRKGRGRSTSSRWSGPSVTPKQNRDRLYACWLTAGSGAYFGLVHGNWVAAGALGVAAVVFGALYLGNRWRRSTRQSRMIGRRKTKQAAAKIWQTLRPQGTERRVRITRSPDRQTVKQVLSTVKQPASINHRIDHSKPDTFMEGLASRQTASEREASEQQRAENERNRKIAYDRMQASGSRVVRGDGKCAAHPDGFDRDCPICLSLIR